MRLPAFEYLEPKNLNEALEDLEKYGNECAVLAGGTDLLVRMKQRLVKPAHVVSLKSLRDLNYIRSADGLLKIGARTPLADICNSSQIKEQFPALFQAISAVGAVSIQHHTGTIGGNLCQDTRCLFYNQSAFWRSGKPPCHKAGGQTCYAREDSDRCHATFQSDGATALIALDARVTLKSARDERTIPLVDLYSTMGDHPLTLAAGELLTEIEIPIPVHGSSSAYHRLAYRSAIDYPIVCAAASLQVSGSRIDKARIVIGAVSRAPLLLAQAAATLEGGSLSDEAVLQKAAAQSMDAASAFIVDNVGSTVEYRTRMIPVMVRRALDEAAQRAADS